MTDYTITEMFTAAEISARVKELGLEISSDYANKEVILLCVLKGALFFTADLAREITIPVKLDCIKISSYNEGTASTGELRIDLTPAEKLANRHVIIVEDIVDMGYTAKWLREYVQLKSPASIKFCALLNKPSRRKVEGDIIDYLGFTIPDEFVVGYGLDYAQKHRNLPFIGKITN